MQQMNPQKHVVIIGAGLAGLAAAYDLGNAGCRVTVLEEADEVGGLAATVKVGGMQVERFYHFICCSDAHLVNLVSELGLEGKIHWQHTRTAFYHNGRQYPFGTPFDLLQFSPIPITQRMRFGIHILSSRFRGNWQALDQISAQEWLIQNIGARAYQVIWYPLLKVKFGAYYDKISAAWIWHRIWRVARSRRHLLGRELFGYLESGSSLLTSNLISRILKFPSASVQTRTPVEKIVLNSRAPHSVIASGRRIDCDAILSTIPLPVLSSLCPENDIPYFASLKKIQYIGVICLFLSLKQSFSPNYWMNINDPRVRFNGMIEYTNLNLQLHSKGLNYLYIPLYIPTSDPFYQQPDELIFQEYLQALQNIHPGFDPGWVADWSISRAPYAQAVCSTGFSKLVPPIQTPVHGFMITDSAQFYPEDRTLSAAIGQGRNAARLLMEEHL